VNKGYLYLSGASNDAHTAGRDAQSDEYRRLANELSAAGDKRRAAQDSQSDATRKRLDREIQDARSRLARLKP
jgi:hypothetical protein